MMVMLSETAERSLNQWLADPSIDEETKQELKELSNDTTELEDRFYRELEFGTGVSVV